MCRIIYQDKTSNPPICPIILRKTPLLQIMIQIFSNIVLLTYTIFYIFNEPECKYFLLANKNKDIQMCIQNAFHYTCTSLFTKISLRSSFILLLRWICKICQPCKRYLGAFIALWVQKFWQIYKLCFKLIYTQW